LEELLGFEKGCKIVEVPIGGVIYNGRFKKPTNVEADLIEKEIGYGQIPENPALILHEDQQ
jgi:hypothetical protein